VPDAGSSVPSLKLGGGERFEKILSDAQFPSEHSWLAAVGAAQWNELHHAPRAAGDNDLFAVGGSLDQAREIFFAAKL